MLWALAQRQNDMNKARVEGREEGRREGREEGRQQVIKEMVKRGITVPPEILEGLDQPEEP